MKPIITEEYRFLISRSPNILGVRFLAGNAIEVIAKDLRFNDVDQVLLTREQILNNPIEP